MRKTINRFYLYLLMIIRVVLLVFAFFFFANKFSGYYTFYNLIELNETAGSKYLILFIANIVFTGIYTYAFFRNYNYYRHNNLVFNIVIASISLVLSGYVIYSFKITNIKSLIIVAIYLLNFIFSLIIVLIKPFINTEHDPNIFRTLCKLSIEEVARKIDINEVFVPDDRDDLKIFNFQHISLRYVQHFSLSEKRKNIIAELEKFCNVAPSSVSFDEILQNSELSNEYLFSLIIKRNKKQFDAICLKIQNFNSEVNRYNAVFVPYYKKFIDKANEYLKYNKLCNDFEDTFEKLNKAKSKKIAEVYSDIAKRLDIFFAELKTFYDKFNSVVPSVKISIGEIEQAVKRIDETVNLKIINSDTNQINNLLMFVQTINQRHTQLVKTLECMVKPFSVDSRNAIYDYYEFKHNSTIEVDELFKLLSDNRILYSKKITDENNLMDFANFIFDNFEAPLDLIYASVVSVIEVQDYVDAYEKLNDILRQSKQDNIYLAVNYLKNAKIKEGNNCINKNNIKSFVSFRDFSGNNILHFYPLKENSETIKIFTYYPELIPLVYEYNNLGILPYDNINFFNFFEDQKNKYELTYETVFNDCAQYEKVKIFEKFIQYCIDNFAMDNKLQMKYQEDINGIRLGSSEKIDKICKKYFDFFYSYFSSKDYNTLMKHIKVLAVDVSAPKLFKFAKNAMLKLDVETIYDLNNDLYNLKHTTISRRVSGEDVIKNENYYSGNANTYSVALVARYLHFFANNQFDPFSIKDQTNSLISTYLSFAKKLYEITQNKTAFNNIAYIDPAFGRENNRNDDLCKKLGIPLGSSIKQIKIAFQKKKKEAAANGDENTLKELNDLQSRIYKLKE